MGKTDKEASRLAPATPSDLQEVKKNDDSASGLESAPAVSVLGLFKFADSFDWLMMALGALGGITSGIALPFFSILLGGLLDDFSSPNPDDIKEAGTKYAWLFGYVAIGATVAAFLQLGAFTISSERQTLRIRQLYLDAILKQEVAFFDKGAGQLSSSIAENTVVIREAMGDKLGLLLQFGTMFVAGFAVGFVINWKLTLVVVAITPLLAGGGFIMMKAMADATSGGLGAYARAGEVAEETISRIRTVASFGLENRLADKYKEELYVAERQGVKKSRVQALGMGLTLGVYFLSYALAFWYGAKLVLTSKDEAAELYPPSSAIDPRCAPNTIISPLDAMELICLTPDVSESFVFANAADVCNCLKCACGCTVTQDCISGGDILRVFFSVVIAAFSLGQAGPSLTALNNGRAAAGRIFAILDRKPKIDASGSSGEKLDSVDGDIMLEGVSFRYPTRPEVQIFNNLSLTLKGGQTTALVGGSGSGKSTITQLVQRFYDPEDGRVTIAGKDIRELNLKWLREQMSLVSQEPILFATTIAENIAYGAKGHLVPSREDIEAAARAANAYDFIMEFADGFDTFVGEGGSSLSGGQKQRIAIARAIIRDPAILILDEATSALDNQSEQIVQAALDELVKSKARTTIVIAHRLSTVRNCDKIIVLGEGKLLEEGSHKQLVAKKGGFYNALLAAAARTKKDGKRASSKRLSSRSANSSSDGVPVGPDTSTLESPSQDDSEDLAMVDEILKRDSKRFSQSSQGSSSPSSASKGQELASAPGDFVDLETGSSSGKSSGGKSKNTEEASEEKEETYSVPMRRVFVFSAPEKWLYVPATFAAIVNGATLPAFAILFSGIATTYFKPTGEEIQQEANRYALYFCGFSVIVALSNITALYYFGVIGERMTTRVRYFLFKSILRQDVGYFDDKKNSVGAITSRLATDAAMVKASLADRLNLVVMNLATVATGLAIAFYYGWKLTLILLGLVPLLVVSGAIQLAAMGTMAKQDDKLLSEAGQVLSESIHGIRTVTAFALRKRVVSLYESFLSVASKQAVKKGLVVGAGFGISQGTMFVVYSVAFSQGARLIADPDEDYDLQKVLNVFFAVVMLGVGMGQSAAMSPDVAKAGVAISNVFRVIDRESKIDYSRTTGLKDEAVTSDDIDFSDVTFAYPTRPDANVFEGFDLNIKGGSTVALVGQSGSGKSTAIALLERFYDPSQGIVRLQGIPIEEANLAWLRGKKLGFVQQEPHLFSGTVYDNIAYGIPESELEEMGGVVPEEKIIEAARAANAHDFICELPEGYQTVVSSSTLSGGQKQRIAIARCLIRDPEVLLLDEATAALDNESEAIVQEALEAIMQAKEKTVIIVAHRLSTIKNADVVCVVHHGQIIEKGTFSSLLANPRSAFAKLHKAQTSH